MANESKKDFNAMLHDSKDMPKIQMVTDPKTIEKYGGTRMYFAPPIDYDKIMRQVPYGKVVTVGSIREHFAKRSGADYRRDFCVHCGMGQLPAELRSNTLLADAEGERRTEREISGRH